MAIRRISAAEAVTRQPGFDAVIDVRSPAEYLLDRLPGALNWPVLNDEERARVGTEYVQVSPFTARVTGAALVARNIAAHIEGQLPGKARGWKPLVYCWRGGQRSGALASVLDAIGFTVHVLDGGYQAFRAQVRQDLETAPAHFDWRVLCGRTGSAKSRLLTALAAQGAQVVDLEALACHRGSVLGPLPGQPQPSQKAFDTALWHALRGLDAARPVFVEGESRTVGRLRVPERLIDALRAAPVVQVRMPLEARVAFLLDDYAHLVGDVEAFCTQLQALRELRGAAVVKRWQELARAGDTAVVRELLEQHYDPFYERSMARHFAHYAQARAIDLPDADAASLQQAAVDLMAAERIVA